jgi:hypothetical protein
MNGEFKAFDYIYYWQYWFIATSASLSFMQTKGVHTIHEKKALRITKLGEHLVKMRNYFYEAAMNR